jgi:DNA mismatch repair protein MutL
MTEIRELDERTVERIAAGEVVERPASAVKELVENSLDADASRVDVRVVEGGTEGIRVADDGVGMTEAELRRAVEEHTTSKIRDIGDLEGGVGTLGFRGEALHAIGAVSRLSITSRPRAGEGGDGSAREVAGRIGGTRLTVEGGEVASVEPAGCPEGTTVEVADLFFNVPARRKYLKRPDTEFAHVNRVVTNYALANPGVAVSLTHGDRETFATTGQGDLRETVMSVYGREVAAGMVPVETTPEGPLTAVSGLVSHPETTRASRDYLSTFVNGRYVGADAVRSAVVDAYDTQLAADRYPFAVLFLAVDPATVDVNVHPRKMAVRFADEDGVREQVRAAVETALLEEGLLRSSAPRGVSAPDETAVEPGGDDPTPDRGADEPADTPEGREDGDRESTRGTEPRSEAAGGVASGDDHRTRDRPARDERAAGTDGDGDAAGGVGGRARGPHRQTRLAPGADAVGERAREFDSLPAMRVLGQFRDTYVVAEAEDGLVLVDQHAADERVNYERLRSTLDDVETQALADPVVLELTAAEAAAFEARAEALARLGFAAERTGERTVSVRTVPAPLAGTDGPGPDLLRDLLADAEGDPAETVAAAVDDLLADLACHPSVTGNTSLTEGSVLDLLERLDDCENPWACPHGRPVLVALDEAELEGRFERDYPGHG